MNENNILMHSVVAATLKDIDNLAIEVSRGITDVLGSEIGFRAGLVITELCTNITRYGYKREAGKTIEIYIRTGKHNVEIEIRDDAAPFNPLVVKEPDLLDTESLQKGGMGIYIVKRLSRKLDYFRDGKTNVVIVTL